VDRAPASGIHRIVGYRADRPSHHRPAVGLWSYSWPGWYVCGGEPRDQREALTDAGEVRRLLYALELLCFRFQRDEGVRVIERLRDMGVVVISREPSRAGQRRDCFPTQMWSGPRSRATKGSSLSVSCGARPASARQLAWQIEALELAAVQLEAGSI
jgi:hypothetical protein